MKFLKGLGYVLAVPVFLCVIYAVFVGLEAAGSAFARLMGRAFGWLSPVWEAVALVVVGCGLLYGAYFALGFVFYVLKGIFTGEMFKNKESVGCFLLGLVAVGLFVVGVMLIGDLGGGVMLLGMFGLIWAIVSGFKDRDR